jgi:hypothetical protein
MPLSVFPVPAVTVSNYLWATMKRIQPSLGKEYGKITPFFPLGDAATGTSIWEDKAYVVYDRMIQATNNPFPYIKSEHIVFDLKGNEKQTLLWGAAIQTILDRQDDSAKDINQWNSQQTNPAHIFFHKTNVFQLRNPEHAREFSNRPYYITKFMIDCTYHFTDTLESLLS